MPAAASPVPSPTTGRGRCLPTARGWFCDAAPQVGTRVTPRFPHLESLSLGAVVPTGLASRPSFVDAELLSDEQVTELTAPELVDRLRKAAPATVRVDTTDNFEVQRDFRIVKVDGLDLRPIYHRLEDRVKAHVLLCMLACYLVWHLRQAWAPLTFTDEHPPQRDNPVAPAERSTAAQHKASSQRDEFGHPYRSFGGLLDHLATLTRNQIRFHATTTDLPMLAEPTTNQRHAFELIGAPIPLTLK
jgi:hypothetical protein